MKKKVFIASAALVIAVGGAFAAKVHSRLTGTYYYNSFGQCVADPNPVNCGNLGSGCVDETIPGSPQMYESKVNSTTCSQELAQEE